MGKRREDAEGGARCEEAGTQLRPRRRAHFPIKYLQAVRFDRILDNTSPCAGATPLQAATAGSRQRTALVCGEDARSAPHAFAAQSLYSAASVGGPSFSAPPLPPPRSLQRARFSEGPTDTRWPHAHTHTRSRTSSSAFPPFFRLPEHSVKQEQHIYRESPRGGKENTKTISTLRRLKNEYVSEARVADVPFRDAVMFFCFFCFLLLFCFVLSLFILSFTQGELVAPPPAQAEAGMEGGGRRDRKKEPLMEESQTRREACTTTNTQTRKG